MLITQGYGDMEFMVRKLLEECEKWGLKINVEKKSKWVVEQKPKISKILEDVKNLSIWE